MFLPCWGQTFGEVPGAGKKKKKSSLCRTRVGEGWSRGTWINAAWALEERDRLHLFHLLLCYRDSHLAAFVNTFPFCFYVQAALSVVCSAAVPQT